MFCSSDCNACLVLCIHYLGFQLTWREFLSSLDFFLSLCPDICAILFGLSFFTRFVCFPVQTFFRSWDFCAFISRLSWINLQAFMSSQNFCALNRWLFFKSRFSFIPVQILTISSNFYAFNRLWWVPNQTVLFLVMRSLESSAYSTL